jgi:hypothetical protein
MNRRHFMSTCGLLATQGAWAQTSAAPESFEQLLASFDAAPTPVEES